MANSRHISGISFVASGSLNVIFNYCSDLNYDVVGIIEDVTIGGDAPSSITYTSNQVTIIYQNYTSPTGGFKTYNVTFGSGYNTDIVVDVLGVNRAFAVGEHIGLAKDCASNMNYTQSIGDRTVGDTTGVYAAVPVADPADVFTYPNLWEVTSSEAAIFNGSQINNIWNTTTGYFGGRAANPYTNVQHVRFIAAVDTSITDLTALGVDVSIPEGLFINALYAATAYPAVTAFDWAMRTPNCKTPNVFNVCKDPASPSYFNLTRVDCDGNTIPLEYFQNTNALFRDGCACTTDCLEVDATLLVTPASSIGAADGSFVIEITGGTANYTYELVVPTGITYLGNATPPITSDSTYTFTNIIGTSANATGIYTISVTDSTGVAGGCTKEFKVHMPVGQTAITGCTNSESLNYNPLATISDDSCVMCKQEGVLVNGQFVGPFVSGISSIPSNASSQSASDGSIEFIGVINPDVLPYLTPTNYNLTLYSTNGYGGALITPAIIGVNGLSSPTRIFQSPDVALAPGNYAITTEHTGLSGCVSTYYFTIGYDVTVPTECDVFINYSVNCGVLTITYESDNEVSDESYFSYLEQQYPIGTPVPVSPGGVVWVTIIFEEGENCETYIEGPVTLGESLFTNENCSGCTDPNASNFNPLATIDDGSCIFGITGCMDPLATNYDPNATIPDNSSCVYACTELEITNISVADSGAITVSFLNITPSYTLTWVNNDTGATITTEDTTTGPDLVDGVYTVTVTDGNGCTDVYILGVNTTIVYGCMDIYADNYNQAANSPDNNCTYSFVPSPCTPSEIEATKTQLDKCLSVKLDMVFNMLKSGRLTLCKEKVAKVLVLLRYLLSRRDLGCVYNCADSLSPTYSETPQGESCGTQWSEGGPTGESLVWDSTVTYLWGDIVQHPTSGDTYTMTYTQGSYTPGSDPETEAGLIFWEYCREPFGFADTTNRLDSYLAFIREECKDCGIPGFTPIPQDVEANQNLPTPTTEGGQRLNIEGDTLEIS